MSGNSRNHWSRSVAMGAFVGLALLAPLAQAQIAPTISGRPGEEHIRSGIGVSVQGGGAVTDFTGSSERGATNVGGSWDIRAVLGTRRIFALEGAYVGSSRTLTTKSLAANTMDLIGNGFEGALRLNAPFLERAVLVEPFAFLGAGWSHYYLTNYYSNTGVLVSRGDSVGTVPMGAGLAVGYRGFLAEARFTYRATYDDNNIVVANVGHPMHLDAWNAGLMVGFEF
jgi:hypothetical protein